MDTKLLIHARDEKGILHRLPIWNNFIKSVHISEAADELKKRHDARLIITTLAEEDYVEFKTEQDMIMFMLKWS